jgi:hypothetical protein
MPRSALPFFLRRSESVVAEEITSTQETIHGLLRLEDDRLVLQWRMARTIDRVGSEIRSDQEFDPVQEVVLSLNTVASASLRSPWWRWGRAARLVLTAADLRAFEPVTGAAGLRLDHPAELTVQIRPEDRSVALEFAADLNLAVAEWSLQGAEGRVETLLAGRSPSGVAPPSGSRPPTGAA